MFYGGKHNTLSLLKTSIHPVNAHVADKAISILTAQVIMILLKSSIENNISITPKIKNNGTVIVVLLA